MFDVFLDKWLKEVGPTEDYFLVLSVGRSFRKSFFPEYKANRKDLKTHPALWALRDEIMERIETVWEENLEADDLIGIRCSEDPKHHLAVSADKDFATIPCQLLIPSSHGRTEPIHSSFTEGEADMNWLRQSMVGDVVDNYKGIYRFGPVGAEKLLPKPEPVDVMWPKVLEMFKSKGYDEEYALTMARLARILRKGEYDFENKEVKLWEPSKEWRLKSSEDKRKSLFLNPKT